MNKPVSGDIWRYDYLWHWQADVGETEGRKARPITFVTVIIDKTGQTNLLILPITSSPPAPDRKVLEIPQIEQRRAGLDDTPLWIILDEYNHDVLETSFHFNPNEKIGRFSRAFHLKALKAFAFIAKERLTKRVMRTE